MAYILSPFIGLLVIGLSISLIERLIPANLRQKRFRDGSSTDLGWWFVNQWLIQPLSQVSILLLLTLPAFIYNTGVNQNLLQGHGFIGQLSPANQFMLILLTGDFIGYWLHRACHSNKLWPIHAIHHSSSQLDWLAAVRQHPANNVINKAPRVMLLVLIGFDLTVMAAYIPFITYYALLQHANVSMRFARPLKWLLVSPHYHRWHHALQGPCCNFAGLFPCWDLMFGTYRLPEHEPSAFGIKEVMPNSLWRQLIWPLRRARLAATSKAMSLPIKNEA